MGEMLLDLHKLLADGEGFKPGLRGERNTIKNTEVTPRYGAVLSESDKAHGRICADPEWLQFQELLYQHAVLVLAGLDLIFLVVIV